MSQDKKLPVNICVSCGKANDAATPHPDNDEKVPSPGMLAMCLGCGHLSVYAEDMTMRELNDQEMHDIAGDPELLRMQAARAAVMERKRQDEQDRTAFDVKYAGDNRGNELADFMMARWPDVVSDLDERRHAIAALALNIGSFMGMTLFENEGNRDAVISAMNDIRKLITDQMIAQAEELRVEWRRRMGH